MSRSRKHTPIIGNCASSEKDDKRRANRKLRRKVNQGELDLILKDVSDPWGFTKDGKSYWPDDNMRK